MLATGLLAVAASLPLGVWPADTGPATVTVDGVEFYLVDPEDGYSIVAIQPLVVPLAKAEPSELKRLAALANRLGADGIMLLGEMREPAIPEDRDAPLPTTGRYSVAVFVSFDRGDESEGKPAVPSAQHHSGQRARSRWASTQVRMLSGVGLVSKGGGS
jgi:hypothetical protein